MLKRFNERFGTVVLCFLAVSLFVNVLAFIGDRELTAERQDFIRQHNEIMQQQKNEIRRLMDKLQSIARTP